MKETLSIFVTMIILVLLIVIFPLYNYFERQDDMSYNLVLKSTTEFVDEIINCGYISQEMYTDYIFQLTNTGNLYDIEIEAHRKVLVQVDGSNVYEEQFLIDYNEDIFDTQTTNVVNVNDKVIKDGVYRLNVGDKIYLKLKNSSTTMAGALFNAIVPTSDTETIKVNYGGIVQNNIWKQADMPLFEEIPIKIQFNLNTKGDNNAVCNDETVKNGIETTILTGSKRVEITIPNVKPTRANCEFKGWSTDKDDTSINASDSKDYIPGRKYEIDSSFTLYAVWQYNDINLTLNANGGSVSNPNRLLKYGGQYTALKNTVPTRSGYDFAGWFTGKDDGVQVTSSTTVTSTNNVTLYAHWKTNTTRLTINPGGGKINGYGVTYTKDGERNSTYTLSITEPPTVYTVNLNGNGGTPTVTTLKSIPTKRTWKHTGGGRLNGNVFTFGGSDATVTVEYSGSSSVTLPNATRNDTDYCTYTFKGWYTSSTGGNRVGMVGDTYTPTSNITLYAQWDENYYKTAVVSDVTRYLNIHSEPNNYANTITGYVAKGTTVTVRGYQKQAGQSEGYYYVVGIPDARDGGTENGWLAEKNLFFN